MSDGAFGRAEGQGTDAGPEIVFLAGRAGP